MTDPSNLTAAIEARVASLTAIKQYTLDLCVLLAEARAKFAHEKDFHAWLLKEKLSDDLEEADAAVKMGSQPALLRQVIEATGRRSIMNRAGFSGGRFV